MTWSNPQSSDTVCAKISWPADTGASRVRDDFQPLDKAGQIVPTSEPTQKKIPTPLRLKLGLDDIDKLASCGIAQATSLVGRTLRGR